MATEPNYFTQYLEDETNKQRFDELVKTSSFNDIVERKKEELGLKAEQKKAEFINHQIGIEDIVDADTLKQFGRLGSQPGFTFDAYETAKYDPITNALLPYLGKEAPIDGSKRSKKWNLHRSSLAKKLGIPTHMVSQRMLNEEADRQLEFFKSSLLKGQEGSDTISVDIRQDGEGYFGRPLITVRNPKTGEIINEVMNTPENNAMFYSKYNREAYADGVLELRAAKVGHAKAVGKGFWDSLNKGLGTGINNLQATGYGFAALLADATGREEFGDWFLKQYLRNIEDAQAMGAHLPGIEDIDWSNPTQVLSKLGALIGEAFPSIALMVGTGGIGGLVAKHAVKGQVKKLASQGLSKEASALITKAKSIGRGTGAYGSAMQMETGSIYGDVAEAGERDARAIWGTLAGGTVAGALEAFYPVKLMNKMGLTRAAKKAAKQEFQARGLGANLRNIGKELLSGGLTEGTTEGLQFITEEVTQDLIKHGHLPDYKSEEFFWEFMNSVVAGLVPGATFSGTVSTVREVNNRLRGDKRAADLESQKIAQEAQEAVDEIVPEGDVEAADALDSTVNTIEETAEELGVELDEGYKGNTTLNKAVLLVDQLNRIENEKKGDTSPEVKKALESLNSALDNYQSGQLATQAQKENVLIRRESQRNIDNIKADVKRRVNEKTPTGRVKTKKAKATIRKEGRKKIAAEKKALERRLKPVKVLQNKGRRAGTKVIRTEVESSVKKINRITRALKNPDLAKKHRKRLERERNSLGRHIENLKGGVQLSATLNKQIENALKSFEFKYKKSNIREDSALLEILQTAGSSETGLTVKAAKLKRTLDDPEATTKEKADAINAFLEDYRSLEIAQAGLISHIGETNDKTQRKQLEDALKDVEKRLEEVQEIYNQTAKIKFKKPSKKPSETDLLYSLLPINEEQLNKFEDLRSQLSDTEKALLDAHILLAKAEGILERSKKRLPKKMLDVRDDVLLGTDKKFEGWLSYLEKVQKGETRGVVSDVLYFLESMENKLTAFNAALDMIAKDKNLDKVWIHKKSRKIITKKPLTKDGKEDKAQYWWVTQNSQNLRNYIAAEIAFGRNVLNIIKKSIEIAPGRAQQIEEDKAAAEAIEAVEKLQQKTKTTEDKSKEEQELEDIDLEDTTETETKPKDRVYEYEVRGNKFKFTIESAKKLLDDYIKTKNNEKLTGRQREIKQSLFANQYANIKAVLEILTEEKNEATDSKVIKNLNNEIAEIQELHDAFAAALKIKRTLPITVTLEELLEAIKEEEKAETIIGGIVKIILGTKPAKQYARDNPDTSVFTMRPNTGNNIPHVNVNQNFGNPWSSGGFQGTIKVKDIDTAVNNYRDWLAGTAHQDIEPKRRAWIIKQIEGGLFDNRELIYFKDGYTSHADVLAEVIAAKKEEKAEPDVQEEEEIKLTKAQRYIDRLTKLWTKSLKQLEYFKDAYGKLPDQPYIKSLQKKAKELKERLDEALANQNNIPNHIIHKFEGRFPKLRNTKLTAFEILTIAQPGRKSFYSRNSNLSLVDKNGKSIVGKLLKDKNLNLKIDNPNFIAHLDNYFLEYKNNFEKYVLRRLGTDKKTKKKEDYDKKYGLPVDRELLNLLMVTDPKTGVNTLPDEIIFAMMMSSIDWMSINQYNAKVTNKQAIAYLLYQDRRHAVTNEEIKQFGNMGILWRNASSEIGSTIFNNLNLKIDNTLLKGLKLDEVLKQLAQSAKEDGTGVLKDASLEQQLHMALGGIALVTATTVHPRGKTKGGKPNHLGFDGLLQIQYTDYHHPTFKENKKNVRKMKTIRFPYFDESENVPEKLQALLKSFKDNKENIKRINGTRSRFAEPLNSPSETVQEFVRNSFVTLPQKVRNVIKKLQNVEWSGKEKALELFELVDESTMDILIGIEILDKKHGARKKHFENSNNEKIKDIQQVRDYLDQRTKDGKLKSFWFKYVAQKQNRIRIDSNGINGQRSKIHRALFMPKSAEVTISTELDRAMYKLGIAQALGYSIDKHTLQESLDAFNSMYELSKPLIRYIKKGNINKEEFNAQLNALIETGNITPSMHVLEALASLANYNPDPKKSFKSASLGIETDGITNGYAIAQMQFMGVPQKILDEGTDEEIVASLVESFARVGVMIEPGETMEKFIKDGKNDVYKELALVIKNTLNLTSNPDALKDINEISKKKKRKANGRLVQINENHLAALNIVHGPLEVEEKISTFGRNLGKNPLMISGYGAEIDRIVKALGEDVVPAIYDKLAEFQVAHDNANATEKEAIEKQVAQYANALNAFLPGINTQIVDALAKGNLKNFDFHKDEVFQIEMSFRAIFEPAITAALEQFTVPLKKARDAIIKSGEIQYISFRLEYDAAIEKYKNDNNVTTVLTSVKKAIAESLALEFMPMVYGPWSSEDTLLQLIKDERAATEDGRIDILFRPRLLKHAVKQGWEFTPYKDPLSKKSIVSHAFSREYVTPGVSMYSNTIQNIDSVLLGEAMLKNPEVLALYDALMSNITDAVGNTNNYNEAFRTMGADFSILENALKRLNFVKGNLKGEIEHDGVVKTKVEAVNDEYQKISFEADQIRERMTSKNKDELQAEIDALGFDAIAEEFSEEITRVNRMKSLLDKAFSRKDKDGNIIKGSWLQDAVISQIYLPESLKTYKGEKAPIEEDTEEITEEVIEEVEIIEVTPAGKEDAINIYYGTGDNANLSNLAKRPFTYAGREYVSVEHAYQSLKSGKFDKLTYQKAWKEGSKFSGRYPADQATNVTLMANLIRRSFEQNPSHRAALLKTGNATFTHNEDKGIWKEKFPEILTRLRKHFIEEDKKAELQKEMEMPDIRDIGSPDVLVPTGDDRGPVEDTKKTDGDGYILFKDDKGEKVRTNEGQTQAIDKMKNWWQKTADRIFVLQGRGGTGKTTIVNKALQVLNVNKSTVKFALPTHKAKQVLMESAEDYTEGQFSTLAKLLGQKKYWDDNKRVWDFKRDDDKLRASKRDLVKNNIKLIVIDEASMVSEDFTKELNLLGKELGIRFIFMGDNVQLPPIEKIKALIKGRISLSTVFDNVMGFNQKFNLGINKETSYAELTQRMRQSNESPILGITDILANTVIDIFKRAVRDPNSYDGSARSILFRLPNIPESGKVEGVHYMDGTRDGTGMDDTLDAFVSEYKEDPAGVKYIHYNNETYPRTKTLRSIIRGKLFPEKRADGIATTDLEALPYIATERIVLSDIIGVVDKGAIKLSDKLHNGDEVTVIQELYDAEVDFQTEGDNKFGPQYFHNIPIKILQVKTDSGVIYELAMENTTEVELTVDLERKGVSNIQTVKTTKTMEAIHNAQSAGRKKYFPTYARQVLQEVFTTQPSAAYLINAHKAQGSTYKTVYADYQNIMGPNGPPDWLSKLNALYVATSRPTTRLVLVGDGNLTFGQGEMELAENDEIARDLEAGIVPQPKKEEGNEEQTYSLDNEIDKEAEKIWDTNSLKNTAQGIFNKLSNTWNNYYPNAQEKQNQDDHLQRVLNEIILPTGNALDNVTLELYKSDIKAWGVVGLQSETVRVHVNKHKPNSYAEQTAQEVYLHELIHILTNSPLINNASFRADIERIRNSVKKELSKMDRPYEIFLHKDEKGNVIYLTDKQTEIAAAKEQYDYVFGHKTPPKYVLDEFLAYALTNKHLVRQLSSMKANVVPLWNKESDAHIVEKLIDMFTELLNRLFRTFQGKKLPKNLQMEIFDLTKEIVTVSQHKSGTVRQIIKDQKFAERYDNANEAVSSFLKDAVSRGLEITSDAYIKGVDKLTKDGKIDKFWANILYDSKLVALMTSSWGKFINDNPRVQQHLDKAFQNFKPGLKHNMASLKADAFGGIPESFIRLLYKSQKEVDRARTQYKELTRESLLNEFKDLDSLTQNEKEAITRVLLKSDFSILEATGAYNMQTALNLLTDSNLLKDEISEYAKKLGIINKKGVVVNRHYYMQAEQLAKFMMGGQVRNHNQFKNAHIIHQKNPRKSKSPTAVADLDVYITLLALQKAELHSKKQVSNVVKREFKANKNHNGITHIIHHHIAFKESSRKEGFNDNPALMTKGYISKIVDPNVQMEFMPTDSKTKADMENKGYKYVSGFEIITGLNDMAYGIYVIENLPDAMRTKGIASVTSKHFSGTSFKEILSRNEAATDKINILFNHWVKGQTKKQNTLDQHHTMMPVINEEGKIVDYSIHMNHVMLERIFHQELAFDQVLPTMYSHQQDKVSSEKINKEAIDLLYDHTTLNYDKAPQRYVNILEGKHKKEIFDYLPKSTRNYILELAKVDSTKKNRQVFYVERKLLDVVFGYKMPSIANSALFQSRITGEAYNFTVQRYAKVIEKMMFELVALAKVNIVIKIPMVLGFNITSNFFTSILYGVPPGYLIKKWREGFKELERYQKDAKKLKLLELKQIGNPALRNDKKIKHQQDVLVEKMNRNKVSKLIDMGLFNSITEDINRNDFTYRHRSLNTLRKSEIGQKFDNLFKGKAAAIANQAYMGEETATFKTMMHLTQASDFIARYAMYSHAIEVKGMPEEKAYKQMVETFVNYDQPLNKYLQYGNDIGLLFFVKYWLRIQRATFNIAKEKPLNIGLLFVANGLLDYDFESIMESSVLTGNFFPTEGGPLKVAGEVLIFPGLEILAGEGLVIG